MEKKVTVSLNFATPLVVILIILKLMNVITVSWWWVFAPYWLPFVLLLVVVAGLALLAFIALLIAEAFK